MTTFIIAATAMFGLLGVTWKSGDHINIICKLLFLGMMTWGIVWIAIIFSS